MLFNRKSKIKKRSISALPHRLLLVMHFRRDVEGRFAPPHSPVALALDALLKDFHVDDTVELALVRGERADVVAAGHAVDRGAEARAEEGVVEVLADDGELGAADAE